MRHVIFCILFFLTCNARADNRALIIGVGNYPNGSGWYHISSVNDVDILRKSLPSDFKIQTLVDEKATYRNIIASLQALNAQTHPGDTLFIHFSCHGQQVIRKGNSEPDYLDESLVPYDALCKRTDTYNAEHHLLDDELGIYLTVLRTTAGPTGMVVVTLDACYSDSMNRGKKDSVVYRGIADIFGSNYISSDSLNTIAAHRNTPDSCLFHKSSAMSDILMISACKSNQKNRELKIKDRGYGSLSYSIYRTFEDKVYLDDITSWTDKVISYMYENVYTQNPQVRTTLHYSAPVPQPEPLLGDESPEDDDSDGTLLIVVITSAILMFIFILLWKKNRK